MTTGERIEIVEGVVCISRDGSARELLRMRRSVESLPEHLREEIDEYFCDSKSGGDHYVIRLRSAGAADAIAPFLPPLRARSVLFLNSGEMVREIVGQA